jgi:hypothetical protein
MVATPLATLNPYIPLDVRKFYQVLTIANTAAPTRGELDAGTDLSPQVTDSNGWSITGTTVASQSFVGTALNLPGPKTIDDSSLTMRLSKTSTDARTILTQDLACYIVVFPEGDVTGRKMDVFTVVVNAIPKSQGIADPATGTFQFAITALPNMRVTIP